MVLGEKEEFQNHVLSNYEKTSELTVRVNRIHFSK